MRWKVCAIVALAAAGPVLSQSTTGGGAGGSGQTAASQPSSGQRPGPDASVDAIRSFVQQQQLLRLGDSDDYETIRTWAVEIDGKPVSLRSTGGGASLQVYLGDEPFPKSRMKTEGKRTILLDSGGKPAGRVLVEDRSVTLAPVGAMSEGRLLIGVSLSLVDPTLAKHLKVDAQKASMISSVTEGWPAAEAGLARGDVIVSVEDRDEGSSDALRAAIGEREAGDEIRLGVISGGERKNVTITLSDEARERVGVASGAITGLKLYQAQQETAADQARAAAGQYRVLAQRAAEGAGRQAEEAAAGATYRGLAQGALIESQRVREQAVGAGRRVLNDWAVAGNVDDVRVTVDVPHGGAGGRAVVSGRGESDVSRRLAALEERIARIEVLLRQLTEQSGGR